MTGRCGGEEAGAAVGGQEAAGAGCALVVLPVELEELLELEVPDSEVELVAELESVELLELEATEEVLEVAESVE